MEDTNKNKAHFLQYSYLSTNGIDIREIKYGLLYKNIYGSRYVSRDYKYSSYTQKNIDLRTTK